MIAKWAGFLPIEGHIVIVEDDHTLRSLMGEIVSEIGAEAVSFVTADDALTHLLQTPDKCRLVIADHGVPGQVQGIEFIEMVNSRWPTIASILTSGYEIEPETVPRGTIYLHKPWSLDELMVAIATSLQPGTPVYKG
ncbi:response regulator [Pseudomonas sp. HN2-3]|uniref:response regulator n=1 Tax=Pseudomonas sp. HN2-3 TaxID=2886360 RepID=UPI001D12B35D|nr:response regulator [Pseudomonas sp. HN2-3]UDU83140.1 response regulator [Pseudomonas sp. HN2-3]